MALEKLQTLPDNAMTGSGIFYQTVTVILAIMLVTFWIATQYVAHKLAYQPSLGTPIYDGGSWKLYMPWEYVRWLLAFGHVKGTERAFERGEWIIWCLHFLVIPAIFIAAQRAKKLNKKSDIHGSAKWATKSDIIEAALLPRPVHPAKTLLNIFWRSNKKRQASAGCYVGAWVDDKTGEYLYLRHDGPEHILAFAPTRSGKGVGLVLPTLLSWPYSAVIHDIKGEAWALTSGYRKAMGQKVLKFEPANPDGSSVRFNPLDEVRIGTMREVADAQNIAQMIVDPDGKGMDDHWAKTGHELLSAAILHILYVFPNKTLRGVVSFFCDPSMTMEQVAESMLNAEHDPTGQQNWLDPINGKPTKTHPVVAESARSFLNKSDNERSGVQSTAMSFLSLYRDPIVAMNTSVSEFKIHDLMNFEVPVSFYIVVPPNDKGRLRPLIRLVLNQIFRQTTEKMDFSNGRSVAGYKHRMLMMLDEFPALGKLELVEEVLAFVAGYGIKCYLITQDLSQLFKAYTKDESILSNSHIRIAYAPNKIETAELLSKYCGVTTIQKGQRSYSGSRLNPMLMHVMASDQETQRPLLTPDECLRLPQAVKSSDGSVITEPGDMLILPAGSNPIYGKQILYFKDPVFDGRSKIPAPLQSDRIIPLPVPAVDVELSHPLAEVPNQSSASESDHGLDDSLPAVGLLNLRAAVSERNLEPQSEQESEPLGSTVGSHSSPSHAAYTTEELAAMDAEEEEYSTASQAHDIPEVPESSPFDTNPIPNQEKKPDDPDLLNFEV